MSDFICKLEHTFKLAYGRDPMLRETRAALLYGQMQNGLKDELMAAPAVSGAQHYDQLCLSARNEEKRLLELRKRRSYTKALHPRAVMPQPNSVAQKGDSRFLSSNPRDKDNRYIVRCYVCRSCGQGL